MMTGLLDGSKRSECIFERASIVGTDFAVWCDRGGISIWWIMLEMEVGGVGVGD